MNNEKMMVVDSSDTEKINYTKCAIIAASLLFIIIVVMVVLIFIYSGTPALGGTYYSLGKSNETFSVAVENIDREKGKEDCYNLNFVTKNKKESYYANSCYDLTIALPKTEYEMVVGNGYNQTSGTVYSLQLYLPNKKREPINTIALYRYSFLGEEDFTKGEIRELITLFNDYTKQSDYDTNTLYEKLHATVIDIYKEDGSSSVDYIKEHSVKWQDD